VYLLTCHLHSLQFSLFLLEYFDRFP
jgi:hypothetical protein